MKNNKPVRIAVAETSLILRSGIISILKRIPEMNIYPMEIVSTEALKECMKMHSPDILIINPYFEGWFDVPAFKENNTGTNIKCISMVCSVIDSALLRSYDESISMYDDISALTGKINKLMHVPAEDKSQTEQEPLSQREKEIIIYVVKGYTNKVIADKLFLSIHTVITHRRNIARKLQIHSPAGLTIYAIVNKLVELKEIEGAEVIHS